MKKLITTVKSSANEMNCSLLITFIFIFLMSGIITTNSTAQSDNSDIISKMPVKRKVITEKTNQKPVLHPDTDAPQIIRNVPGDFATIQAAINAANNGDIVLIAAGTYREDIILNKYLKIRGANFGINPNTGIRGAETIIQPATSNPDPYSPTYVKNFYIGSNGSSSIIDGITFDGDNPLLTSGVLINGADIDAAVGIAAYDDLSNTTISNNIFKNINYTAIDLDNVSGTSTYDNSVNDNLFDNMNVTALFGIAVVIYDNCYTSITDNVMTRTRIGIQTGNFFSADIGANHSISNNTMDTWRLGIFHNLAYTNATTYIISNNVITTMTGAPKNNGIEVASIQSSVGVSVTDNNVTGARYGYNLWNCPTTNTVTVTGGTLTTCNVGVFANNFDGYNSDAATSSYAMTGITMTNCDTAIWVRDNNLNTNSATVALSINNTTNVVTGTGIGLLIEGGDASVAFAGAVPVNFSTTLSKYIRLQTNGSNVPTANINAETVQFGGTTGAGLTDAQLFAVEDKIDHKIDWSDVGYVSVKANNDYVTANSFYPPNTSTPSIQRGIDAASAGYIENVQAGTYVENFVVTKSLDIRGPNYNINPNTGSRVTEAILMPAIDDPESGVLADIEASNVLINGFLLDGDNPSLGGGYAVGTADVNTSEGIQNGPTGGGAAGSYFQGDHFDIQNNIFNNFDYQAVYFRVAFNSNHSWNYIKNNKFNNMWEGVQTYALHADISFNTFTGVDRAISMHAVHAAADFGFVPQIDSNSVSITWKTIYSRNIGIWVNYRDGSAPALEVKNNTIDCSDPSLIGQKFFGFYALTLLDNRIVTFSNNTITGAGNCSRGFYMTNCPSSNVTLSGGAFNNIRDYGILMVNNDLTWGPGDVRLTVTNLPITMSPGASAGILDSTDNNFALNSFTANLIENRFDRQEPAINESNSSNESSQSSTLIAALDISNSTITGGAKGILVKGTLASANIHDNSSTITGALIGVDVDGGTATLFRNNITANGTGVRVKNSGNLTSATENFITSNTANGIDIEATAGTIGVVTDNNLSGNTGYAINYLLATPALSATCNWYGTPFVATKINVIANVNYIPFLTNGTDNDTGTNGFQQVPGSCNGPLTRLYVNDNALTGDVYTTAVGNDANAGTPSSPFLTINFAISVANTGDTIYVDVGGYPENVIINKSLKFFGAKAGVDARGRVVGSPSITVESVITPATGASIEFQPGSNLAIIDGFAMLGNVGGTQGVIQNQTGGPYNGLQFKNNYAKPTSSNGQAVWFQRSVIDATFDKNEFVGNLTSTQVFYLSTQSHAGFVFTNNNVLGGGGTYGLYVDGVRNVGTSSTPRNPLIKGNLFQGHQVGINGGSRSFENTQFLENTFNGNSIGGFQGGPKNSNFARNTFTANGQYGLVFTAFGNTVDVTRGAQGTTVQNNFFSGNAFAGGALGDIAFSNQPPGTQNSNTITNNSFGSTVAIRNNEPNGNTDIIHATCNWYGTATPAGVSSKITSIAGGVVNYVPWLTNGTDDSLGVPGFQPVPGTCNGTLTNLYVNDNVLVGDVYTTAIGNDANPGTSSAPFATIAYALTQANAGDTIYVDAGNYPQTSALSISFGITVLGSNAGIDPQRPISNGMTQNSKSTAKETTDSRGTRNAEAIVDFTGLSATGTLITITSSTQVKLDGLDFKDDFPITAAGSRSIMTVITNRNHKIINNIISRSAASEPLTGSSVAARGIEIASIGSGDSITIANNQFNGNLSAIFTNKNFRTGIYYNGGLGIVDVADNEFNYCRTAMNVDDITSGLLITGNAFDSNGTAISLGGSVALTGSYAFGANDFSGLGTIINCSNVAVGFYLDLTSSTYTGIPFSSLTLPQLFGIEAIMVHGTNTGKNGLVRVIPNHVYVLPTTAPASLPKGGLQRGVNIALATDTVNTDAGNYTEQIEINKDLAVIGQGAGLTNVIAPASLPLFFTTSANNYPVIYAHDAVKIIVRNLTVDGAGQGNANSRLAGVGYYQAGGFIRNLEIKAVRNNPIDGAQGGTGIFAYANTGTARTVSVIRNTVYDFQKNGITIAGAVLTASVDSNIVTGAGAVSFIAQNGVQLSSGATGSITNNTISGFSYIPATFGSAGVLVLASSGSIITSGNSVNNAQLGIIYFQADGTINKNIVKYNAASMGATPYWYGIVVEEGTTIVSQNTVNGGGNGAGIEADAVGSLDAVRIKSDAFEDGGGIKQSAAPENTTMNAVNNYVDSTDEGFVIYTSGASTVTGTINDNSITHSVTNSIHNYGGINQSATCNWYGTINSAAIAAKIAGPVTYVPFLTNGTDDSLGIPGFQPVPGYCNGPLSKLYVNDNVLVGDVYTTAVGNDANPGTSSAPFATIAYALAQANAGDTIYVDAGNYPQTSALSVSYGITVLGSNAGIDPQRPVNNGIIQNSKPTAKETTDSRGTRNAEAIVDFTGLSATGTLITITSSTQVKLDGLDFKDDFPITAAGSRSIMTVITNRNHKIINNIISRSAASEPLTGSSVAARGIEIASIGSGDSITIANNQFNGNLSAIFTNKNFRTGIYYNGGPGIVDVADNEFNYCRTAINADDITSGLLIAGNAFDSNGTAISLGGTIAPTGSYAFGANDFSGTGTIINCSNVAVGFYLDLTSSTYTGIPFSSLTLPQLFGIEAIMIHGTNTGKNGLVRVIPNHVYVLPTTAPASSPKGGLQRGVNIALAADTVNTASGNYTEQIEINKDLAVIGQGSGLTNVIAPVSLPLFFTTSGINRPVIYAHDAVKIVVRNLTVDGAGQGNANTRLVGVGYYQAGGFIRNIEVKSVRDNPLSGSQQGTGIFAYANTGTARTVSVIRNTVYDFQKNGITIAGAVLTASVDSNTVSGIGPTSLIAQNGIQIADGVGSVTNNNISGIYYTPASVFACGILSFDNADTLKINRNIVSNCQGSIYAENNVSVISSNVISGGSFTDAIDIISYYSGEITNSIVTNNAISSCAWGTYIYSNPAGSADAEIHNNSISGSSIYAIHNDGSIATVDAECNWYGTASEAGIVPQISGTVDYDPWLTNGTDNDPIAIGFQPVPNSCNGLPLIAGKLDLTVNLEAYSPIPDTVIVTLRSIITPYPVIAVDTGKLDVNGDVSLTFNNVSNGPSYYIVVNHRQSIETWSATGQTFTSGFMAYDFTSDSTQAYGDNLTFVGAKASLYTGDVNQDYIVDLTDLGIMDNDVLNYVSGPYEISDLNGDGIVDLSDMSYADNNAYNIVQKKMPSLRPGNNSTSKVKKDNLSQKIDLGKIISFTRRVNRDL